VLVRGEREWWVMGASALVRVATLARRRHEEEGLSAVWPPLLVFREKTVE
jgi:hypothetical protein